MKGLSIGWFRCDYRQTNSGVPLKKRKLLGESVFLPQYWFCSFKVNHYTYWLPLEYKMRRYYIKRNRGAVGWRISNNGWASVFCDRTERSASSQDSPNVCADILHIYYKYTTKRPGGHHKHLKCRLSLKLFPSWGGHKIYVAEMRKRLGAASEVQEFLLSSPEHERFRDTQQWRTRILLFIELCADTRSAAEPSSLQHCH